MPPAKRIQKEAILETAYELAKTEGLEMLNARRIAKELNCSTQPIYHNFDTMEELKGEVYRRIYQTYTSYVQKGAREEKAYLGMGLAYIRFAKDYPNFFQALFMKESGQLPLDFLQGDVTGKDVLKQGQLFSGLNEEQGRAFHLKVWIFTHGLATLAATNTVRLTNREIRELLASTTRELLAGFLEVAEKQKP